MKLKLSQKNQKLLMLFTIGCIIVLAGNALFAVNIGGSGWQFDYKITEFTVNGVAQGTPENPPEDTPPTTDTSTWGDWDFFDVIYQSPYQWHVDPDGHPRWTGTYWAGLVPAVATSTSQPWRVDMNGKKIPALAEDPFQVSRQIGDEVWYEYYYDFTVYCETRAKEFTVPTLIGPYTSCECGNIDAIVSVRVSMAKTLFSDVTGEFMDAQVVAWEGREIPHQSGVQWVVVPSQTIGADYTAIAISNRQPSDNGYTCDLTVPFSMTSGMVKSGVNNLPFNVGITQQIRMTLLLKQPLDVGSIGEEQVIPDPPKFTTPMSLGQMILLFMGIVLAIVVLLVVWRVVGIIGIFARRK